jgi:hypothetical protein
VRGDPGSPAGELLVHRDADGHEVSHVLACGPGTGAPEPDLSADIPAGAEGHLFLVGWAPAGTAHVEVGIRDGRTVIAPVEANGWFLELIPTEPGGSPQHTTHVRALDQEGRTISEQPMHGG